MEDKPSNNSALSSLFFQAQKQFQELETSSDPTNSPVFQNKVKSTVQAFNFISQKIESLHLFSKNEELEDIPTTSLPYLFLNYYMAELVLKIADPSNRLSSLQTAKTCFETYIESMGKLGILSKKEVEATRQTIDFESKATPQVKRQEKIERFKKEKEVNNKLKALLERQKQQQTSSSSFDGDDEETLRAVVLTQFSLFAFKALDSLDLTKQELEMLETMEKIKSGQHIPQEKPKESSPTPFKNVVILPNRRQDTLNQVFRPGWNLPTMTVEEWGEYEYQMMKERESKQESKPPPKKPSEDSDEEEESVVKTRNWDDWKDDNPKGSGNMNDFYFRRS